VARAFIYFDAGGTLIAPYPSVGAVYANAGRAHGLAAGEEAIEAAFARAWDRRMADPASEAARMGETEDASRAWWRALVEDVFAEVAFAGDRAACFTAFYDAFAKPDAWLVFDDVRPTLRALAERGHHMGVISNWDIRLYRVLEALELSRYFDPILISACEGVAKPDPRLFELGCARAGVAPANAVYVGDHLAIDVEPAERAGLTAYLIDRRGRHSGANVLRSLTELLSRV
jgi:putative hydrolase of the HAD superfamily